MEATSINVQKLCEDFLNHRLLWYMNKKLPEYTSTVALVLFNGDVYKRQHVDVAMFCIYSLYNKRQVDRLIAAYFTEGCSDETRIKIYCYIAACGLLWSNWCEYKLSLIHI